MNNPVTFEYKPENWLKLDEIIDGTRENMFWYLYKNNMKFVFKPESDKPDEKGRTLIEYQCAQIAEKLDIPHAQTELTEIDGKFGLLSSNAHAHKDKYDYHRAGDFAKKNGHADYVNDEAYLGGISLKTIKEKYPQLESDIVNMLFIDCLVRNTDRHRSNWEIICDKDTDSIRGLCPLYDFDNSLNPRDYTNSCIMAYDDKEGLITHNQMFDYLCKDYPKQISLLLEKTRSFADTLPEVAKRQFKTMDDIYYGRTSISHEKETTVSIKEAEIIMTKTTPDSIIPDIIFDDTDDVSFSDLIISKIPDIITDKPPAAVCPELPNRYLTPPATLDMRRFNKNDNEKSDDGMQI